MISSTPVEAGYTRLADGSRAYVARPANPSGKGLVLLASMPGLHLFEGRCHALAAEHGWMVVAPELISETPGLSMQERDNLVVGLDDEVVLGKVRTAAAETGAPTVSTLGFCVGGMYAMKAASLPELHAAVAFYGMIRLPERWRGPGQREPLTYVQSATIPVLAIFGGTDDLISLADLPDLERAGARTVVYPEAGHAFAHDLNHSNHRPDDAADAWRRAKEFLFA